MLRIVPEKLDEAQFGMFERLCQGGSLHFSGVVGHGKVDRGVGWVGEIVVTSLSMIEEVPRVLEGPDDLSRFECGNAGAHGALHRDRYPLRDRTAELDTPLQRDGLSVLPEHLEVPANGFLHALSRFPKRVALGDHPGKHWNRDRVSAFGSRLK